MEKIQKTITLIINAEYDETKTDKEKATDMAIFLAINPNFATICNSVHLIEAKFLNYDGEVERIVD